MAHLPRAVAIGGLCLLLVAAAGVAGWFLLFQPAPAAATIARPGAPAPQIALQVVRRRHVRPDG